MGSLVNPESDWNGVAAGPLDSTVWAPLLGFTPTNSVFPSPSAKIRPEVGSTAIPSASAMWLPEATGEGLAISDLVGMAEFHLYALRAISVPG